MNSRRRGPTSLVPRAPSGRGGRDSKALAQASLIGSLRVVGIGARRRRGSRSPPCQAGCHLACEGFAPTPSLRNAIALPRRPNRPGIASKSAIHRGLQARPIAPGASPAFNTRSWSIPRRGEEPCTVWIIESRLRSVVRPCLGRRRHIAARRRQQRSRHSSGVTSSPLAKSQVRGVTSHDCVARFCMFS